MSKKHMVGITLSVLLAAVLGVSPACAAEEDVVQVKVYLSKDGVHPGENVRVAFLAQIAPGWHMQNYEQEDEFLFPTALIIEECDQFKVDELIYPKPKAGKFEYSEAELNVFEGDVIFGALLKGADAITPGEYTLKGRLKYQACDHTSCLPPKTINLEIPIKVVPPGEATNPVNEELMERMEAQRDKKAEKK